MRHCAMDFLWDLVAPAMAIGMRFVEWKAHIRFCLVITPKQMIHRPFSFTHRVCGTKSFGHVCLGCLNRFP